MMYEVLIVVYKNKDWYRLEIILTFGGISDFPKLKCKKVLHAFFMSASHIFNLFLFLVHSFVGLKQFFPSNNKIKLF